MKRHLTPLAVVAVCALTLLGCPPNEPPLAEFQATPREGTAPLTVQFMDFSLPGGAEIESRVWDFGDNSTSTESNPVHVYEEPGVYDVRLKVTTEVNSNTLIMFDYIEVHE